MKKRTERISREAFLLLSRPERTQHSPFTTLRRFLKKTPSPGIAFLVTISKKEIPTAVKRNLLRRRYAQILRTHASSLGSSGVFQCVVKKKALSASFQELVHDMDVLLKERNT